MYTQYMSFMWIRHRNPRDLQTLTMPPTVEFQVNSYNKTRLKKLLVSIIMWIWHTLMWMYNLLRRHFFYLPFDFVLQLLVMGAYFYYVSIFFTIFKPTHIISKIGPKNAYSCVKKGNYKHLMNLPTHYFWSNQN